MILPVDFKLWLRLPDLFTDELRQFPSCELQVGHILKFRYRGEGRLSVKIFDDTFCRRSFYPPLEDGFDPDDP